MVSEMNDDMTARRHQRLFELLKDRMPEDASDVGHQKPTRARSMSPEDFLAMQKHALDSLVSRA